MAWNFLSDKPLYTQIIEKIQLQIISGHYPAGSRLPSVREFASVAGVNPNTMQKAFSELERSGLIMTQRTSGRTVTEDNNMIIQIRTDLAREQIETFLANMQEMGFSKSEIAALIDKAAQEGENK